jgi:hypothetical protein
MPANSCRSVTVLPKHEGEVMKDDTELGKFNAVLAGDF